MQSFERSTGVQEELMAPEQHTTAIAKWRNAWAAVIALTLCGADSAHAQFELLFPRKTTLQILREGPKKNEPVEQSTVRLLDSADQGIRTEFSKLQERSFPANQRYCEKVIERIYRVLDTQPLDMEPYLQRDIEFINTLTRTPVSSGVMATLCKVEEWMGKKPTLQYSPQGYTVRANGSDWTITPSGHVGHPLDLTFSVQSPDAKTKTTKMTTVSAFEIAHAVQSRDFTTIANGAEKHWAKELNGRKSLEEFDIPRNTPVTVLQIIAADGDPVVGCSILQSYLFTRALRERSDSGKVDHKVLITHNPKRDAGAALHAIRMQAEKQKEPLPYCILEFVCHGSPEGLAYGENTLRQAKPVSGDDVDQILGMYDKKKCHVQTFACHGGGLCDEKEFWPATTFTHTSGRALNYVSVDTRKGKRLITTDDYRGSPFMVFLVQSMHANPAKPFGWHVAQADERTKKFGLNPEAKIGGKKME